MMRVLLVLALLCLGCSLQPEMITSNGETEITIGIRRYRLTEIQYQGHDYLVLYGADCIHAMTHKGNCRACSARNQIQ